MNFKEYIAKHKPIIHSKIMQYLPLKEPLEHYKIAREYGERQGGYRRPGLVMLTGQLFGAKPEDLLLPSAAMQASEDWILIHDDIEDNSELRRGMPALHKIYGIELAINAGDAVHISMWKMLKDHVERVGLKKGMPLLDKFYDMLELTVEGQFIETNFIYNTRSIAEGSENLYLRIAASKTCYYSLYGPMQLGAIAAGKKGEVLNVLKQIGSPAGVAFQMVDDILDMTADEKVFGKRKYGDLYEGKLTMIMLHTYENASSAEKKKIDAIYKKKREEKSAEEIALLADMVKKYDGIGYAKEKVSHYAMLATKAAEQYKEKLPNNQYRDILFSAIEEMYKREK
jgi:geranylgeranyl pyrophosphate synthase